MPSRQNRSLSCGSEASTVSSEYSMTSTMLYAPSTISYASETVPEFTGNPLPHQPDGVIRLPCEFVGLGPCDEFFQPDESDLWVEHIIDDHLERRIPSKVICWFCDRRPFDAGSHSHSVNLRINFQDRMRHIRNHIVREGKTVHHMRPDYHMVDHLQRHGLISAIKYRLARSYPETPRVEGIYPSDHVPPELEQRLNAANQVVIGHSKEDRDHRRRQHRKDRSKRH